MLVFFFYLNTYGKKSLIRWVAKNVFRNQMMSEKSAESLITVVTSFIFVIGGLWVILAILFLTN